ncbi:MAG: NAD+ synthase [Acidobacteriia bacterium]|nr:NAD+ synthase [Terriglobia bacterium]
MDITTDQVGALPPLNSALALQITIRFIGEELHKAGFENVVLGLSGGIDSSVVAALAARALGPERVTGVLMPYRTSSPDSLADAHALADQLGIRREMIDISPIADGFLSLKQDLNNTRKGNVLARARMIVLYDFSAELHALVLGTSNKTEILLGYGTLYGDLASALNPVGDLYKTEIRQLAAFLNIPEKIISKPPTADLWIGQSDEAELGFSYAEVDRLLYHRVDLGFSPEKLVEMGFNRKFVARVLELMRLNQFKRCGPLVCKLSPRTVTHDFLYPRDWGM